MSLFQSPPKPTHPLAYHRILSPSASVKVSPIALGGISIGSSWSSIFGRNEDSDKLLDAYFEIGGNFIDTSNTYNSEDSERLIGSWMSSRGIRDQMVIATKYTAGYKGHSASIKHQSNYTGNSVKSMHVSVRDSLEKLQTDYIDILYVHWWDHATSVEEMMRGLNHLCQQGKVLYLGASDIPAWVVVKANMFARSHGLTPFSVYQGRWNAAYRDIEAEIIPMCEDQGLAIVPWAALGGGQLISAQQRKEIEGKEGTRPARYSQSPSDKAVCDAIEKISTSRGCSFPSVALAYLFAQSTYVFPIVGVQTVEHVKAMPDALGIKLTEEEITAIQAAASFTPLFPTNFLFNFRGDQPYTTKLTASDNQQYQMSSWIDAPVKGGGFVVRES